MSFSSFLAKFLFYISSFVSNGWPNLVQPLYTYDNARFSLFTEDIVVGCDQVTEPFRAWYVDFGMLSVRSSRNFGPLEDLAMRVL